MSKAVKHSMKSWPPRYESVGFFANLEIFLMANIADIWLKGGAASEVPDRAVPSYSDDYLIIGEKCSASGTVVERSSRNIVLMHPARPKVGRPRAYQDSVDIGPKPDYSVTDFNEALSIATTQNIDLGPRDGSFRPHRSRKPTFV